MKREQANEKGDKPSPPLSQELQKDTLELTLERDKQQYALGDTYDIKTSIVLVGLTFLAVQSSDLLKLSQSPIEHAAAYTAILVLAIGGILTAIELWPRKYSSGANPEQWITWLLETERHYQPEGDVAKKVLQRSREVRMEQALECIRKNQGINEKKYWFMVGSLGCAVIAFALNIATLLLTTLR